MVPASTGATLDKVARVAPGNMAAVRLRADRARMDRAKMDLAALTRASMEVLPAAVLGNTAVPAPVARPPGSRATAPCPERAIPRW